MAEVEMDLKGLKCPQPILKIQSKAATLSPGTIIKAVADCSSFERDLNVWASKMGKTILECVKKGDVWEAKVRI
jgi:tRNA 2-thiouridine synthesizing protein A